MKPLMQTLPASFARSNFYQMLEEVDSTTKQFHITHRGHRQAVLISADELASWQETLEIVTNTKLLSQIKQGLKDISAGKVFDQKTADQAIGW